MGMADFFETITQPYFYRTIAEDFGQFVDEIKEDTKTLVEELDEIVHKENAFSLNHKATEEEMKTTVDLREDAEKAFREKRAKLVKTRGFSDEQQNLIAQAVCSMEQVGDLMATEEQQNDSYREIITEAQQPFRHFKIVPSSDLIAISNRIEVLLRKPDLPDYQQPQEDKGNFLDVTDRDERISANKSYLASLDALCQEMDKETSFHNGENPIFSAAVWHRDEEDSLHSLVKIVKDAAGFGGFFAWRSLPHLSYFQSGDELIQQGLQLKEKENKALLDQIRAVSAIYKIIAAPLNNQKVEDSCYADIKEYLHHHNNNNEKTT